MKVVLDLTRLLRDGKITREEHDGLQRFAAGETGSPAINVAVLAGGLQVLAFAIGVEVQPVLHRRRAGGRVILPKR